MDTDIAILTARILVEKAMQWLSALRSYLLTVRELTGYIHLNGALPHRYRHLTLSPPGRKGRWRENTRDRHIYCYWRAHF